MKVRISEINPHTVPFSQVKAVSEAIIDAFQRDIVFELLLGPRYFMPVPPPAGQIRYHRKYLFYYSLSRFSATREAKKREWVMTAENGDIVGFVSWTIPPVIQSQLSMWQRAKNWVLAKLASVVGKILFCGEGDLAPPNRLPLFRQIYAKIDEQAGFVDDDALLARSSSGDREKAIFSNHCWWCNLMVVSPKYQNKGYGYQLFKHSLDQLAPQFPVFTDNDVSVRGPAQYALYASLEGRKLYERAGFVLRKDLEAEWDGRVIDSPLYVKTVDFDST